MGRRFGGEKKTVTFYRPVNSNHLGLGRGKQVHRKVFRFPELKGLPISANNPVALKNGDLSHSPNHEILVQQIIHISGFSYF